LTGSPAGGIFSGLGVSGNTFNPNTVGTNGSSTVSYNYSASPNCTSSVSLPISVSSAYNCDIPQNVSVSQIAKKTAVISWNGSAAPSFKIRYRKTGSTTYLYKNINWTPCNATSVQLTGLISNSNYTVDVKAVCASGTNTYSQSVTFRTLATNPVSPVVESRFDEAESLNEAEKGNVVLFPNPFENNLEIRTNQFPEGAIIQITDIAGRVVFQSHYVTNNVSVNTSEWPRGIYFLRLNEQNFKLIKD